MTDTSENPTQDYRQTTIELLDYAWSIICNASGGDWDKESAEWVKAAKEFGDQYHALKGGKGHSTSHTPPGAPSQTVVCSEFLAEKRSFTEDELEFKAKAFMRAEFGDHRTMTEEGKERWMTRFGLLYSFICDLFEHDKKEAK